MDDIRFDRLAAALATAPSRRRLLGTLLGTTLTAFLGWPETAARRRRKRRNCPPGRPRCGTKCCEPFETCQRGRCVHHCNDGRKNLGETDKDCGGTCLPETCAILKRCQFDADCFTGICEDTGPGGTKECAQCRIDSDCNSQPGTPRCIEHFCHDCAADFDCPAPGDFPEKRFCIAPADAGCPGGPCICPNNVPCVCRECRLNTDSDCPQGKVCNDGDCRDCREDSDCPEGQLCDGDGRCEGFACDSSEDCPQGQLCDGQGNCVECIPEGGACTSGDGDLCCEPQLECVAGGFCSDGCRILGNACSNFPDGTNNCCKRLRCVGDVCVV